MAIPLGEASLPRELEEQKQLLAHFTQRKRQSALSAQNTPSLA